MGATGHDLRPLIQVVDDDASVRGALERVFRVSGYPVRIYASAAQFFARDPSDADGCVILDLGLDGIGGLDVQRTLAASDRQLPVIFLTGQIDPSVIDLARDSGAIDVLTKPVPARTLVAAVERAVAAGQRSPS